MVGEVNSFVWIDEVDISLEERVGSPQSEWVCIAVIEWIGG